MPGGPITIYDKSALEALSIDDAALFGQFFRVNLTPIFFVETLVDLDKHTDRIPPETLVGALAWKTANQDARANVHHDRLICNELLGGAILMDGRPHIDGGLGTATGDHHGTVYRQAAEAESLRRWRERRFLDIEQDFARDWRQSLRGQTFRRSTYGSSPAMGLALTRWKPPRRPRRRSFDNRHRSSRR